jgi:hypothetical protein
MDYKWTIYKMITRERAEAVARELFPNDYLHRKYDCMDEPGRNCPAGLCSSSARNGAASSARHGSR